MRKTTIATLLAILPLAACVQTSRTMSVTEQDVFLSRPVTVYQPTYEPVAYTEVPYSYDHFQQPRYLRPDPARGEYGGGNGGE